MYVWAPAMLVIAADFCEKVVNAPEGQEKTTDAYVAIVFAAFALEAFINEMGSLALMSPGTPHDPPSVKSFGVLWDESEKGRASVEFKFNLARSVFAGATYDRGAAPYQDFALLMDVRDGFAHIKPRDRFELIEEAPSSGESGKMEHRPAPIVDRLRGTGILGDLEPGMMADWMTRIRPREAARWSRDTALAMIRSVIDFLPQGYFRGAISFQYRRWFGDL